MKKLDTIMLLLVVSIVDIAFVADILLLFCLPFVVIFGVVDLLCLLLYFSIVGAVLLLLSITTNTTHGVIFDFDSRHRFFILICILINHSILKMI